MTSLSEALDQLSLPTTALQEAWRVVILAIQDARFDRARDRAFHYALGWVAALLAALVIDDDSHAALIDCCEGIYSHAKAYSRPDQAQ